MQVNYNPSIDIGKMGLDLKTKVQQRDEQENYPQI